MSLAYNSPSVIGPVHNLRVGEIIVGMYGEIGAVLKPRQILRESYIPARAMAERR